MFEGKVCLGGGMVRGGVVEFVMEFCLKVVAAVGFYA